MRRLSNLGFEPFDDGYSVYFPPYTVIGYVERSRAGKTWIASTLLDGNLPGDFPTRQEAAEALVMRYKARLEAANAKP